MIIVCCLPYIVAYNETITKGAQAMTDQAELQQAITNKQIEIKDYYMYMQHQEGRGYTKAKAVYAQLKAELRQLEQQVQPKLF